MTPLTTQPRRNPYRRTVRWLSTAWYSFLSFLGLATLGLIVVAVWEDVGAWALVAVPGTILGLILLFALLAGASVAVQQWWSRREAKWDEHHN